MNQYTAIGAATPTYDLDGNATSYPMPAIAGGNSTLIWDAENRLIEVKDDTTTKATYQYDYLGRRISKTVGTATTRFIYDGWNPVADYTATIPNSTFLIRNSYTWGMDLSGSMQGAGGVGGLLAVNELSIINSQLSIISYYPTFDGNGNVSEYLDTAGAVQAHYEYDAFGNTLVTTGTKANDFAHRFSTKPLDAETGLYYYGYRYYDPKTGSWPSRDPIEERGGVNLYGFIENNGINATDFLGNKTFRYDYDSDDEPFEDLHYVDYTIVMIWTCNAKIEYCCGDGVWKTENFSGVSSGSWSSLGRYLAALDEAEKTGEVLDPYNDSIRPSEYIGMGVHAEHHQWVSEKTRGEAYLQASNSYEKRKSEVIKMNCARRPKSSIKCKGSWSSYGALANGDSNADIYTGKLTYIGQLDYTFGNEFLY